MAGPHQVTAEHQIFLEALDQLNAGISIYNASGEVIYQNTPMSRLLEKSSSRAILLAALEPLMAAMVCATQSPAREGGSPVRKTAEQIWELARDGTHTFRLQVSRIGEGVIHGGASILVTLERTWSCPPSERWLHKEFGLTAAECRVAILLSEGRSNGKIAEELKISPHTARNHTRAVLGKLGVTSRAQVAALLQRLHPA